MIDKFPSFIQFDNHKRKNYYKVTVDNLPPILVVNSGSSSLKLCMFAGKEPQRLQQNDKIDFSTAFQSFSSDNITAIGHRIVHGGPNYSASAWIDENILQELEELSQLAPLHNIPSINAIRFCNEQFPKTPQYAVFDTAFHRRMPLHARTYAIPLALSKKYQIERYGFHGIAHAYSYNTFQNAYFPGKVISCHLGSGCSITAINKGQSIDTSMGFTPNEGLMMSTRCGDIDPGIIEFLSEKKGFAMKEIQHILNFQSGLLGVSGVSTAMQEIMKSTDQNAILAIDLFCYRVLKMIGAYLAALQGCDAILFSGGIGENASEIRQQILDSLEWAGIKVDYEKNKTATRPQPAEIFEISSPASKIKICVIGNDESTFIYEQYSSLSKFPVES